MHLSKRNLSLRHSSIFCCNYFFVSYPSVTTLWLALQMANSVETSLLKKFRLKAIFKPAILYGFTLPSSTKYKTVLIDTSDQKEAFFGLFGKNCILCPKNIFWYCITHFFGKWIASELTHHDLIALLASSRKMVKDWPRKITIPLWFYGFL